jgi:hypothetical protein
MEMDDTKQDLVQEMQQGNNATIAKRKGTLGMIVLLSKPN